MSMSAIDANIVKKKGVSEDTPSNALLLHAISVGIEQRQEIASGPALPTGWPVFLYCFDAYCAEILTRRLGARHATTAGVAFAPGQTFTASTAPRP